LQHADGGARRDREMLNVRLVLLLVTIAQPEGLEIERLKGDDWSGRAGCGLGRRHRHRPQIGTQ
jgi:hypothetical protein